MQVKMFPKKEMVGNNKTMNQPAKKYFFSLGEFFLGELLIEAHPYPSSCPYSDEIENMLLPMILESQSKEINSQAKYTLRICQESSSAVFQT